MSGGSGIVLILNVHVVWTEGSMLGARGCHGRWPFRGTRDGLDRWMVRKQPGREEGRIESGHQSKKCKHKARLAKVYRSQLAGRIRDDERGKKTTLHKTVYLRGYMCTLAI